MITQLSSTMKRAIRVNDQDYTLILSPDAIRITPKGKRRGVEFKWEELLGGGDALVGALNASLRLPAV